MTQKKNKIDKWLNSKTQSPKVEVAALAFAAECSRQRCAELEAKLKVSQDEFSQYKARSTAAAQHLASRLESAFARALAAEAACDALRRSILSGQTDNDQIQELVKLNSINTQPEPIPPPPPRNISPPIEVTPRKSKNSTIDGTPLRRSSRLTAKKLQRSIADSNTEEETSV
mmetsp:Transcript_10584/g.13147  ORF Transcript_10584/g.13147 Transcript_10584/m.13147 type:complete len:172 (+) Transcript_10584:461-976(+)